jgi:hypothetical protein
MELFKTMTNVNNCTVAKLSSFSRRNFQALVSVAHAFPVDIKITRVPLDI